jgi:Ca2+-binding RTX toxin-like protein
MKEQCRTPRSVGRAAAATTLIGLAVTVATAPAAQAAPAPASASVSDHILSIHGTKGADQIDVDFTALDSVAVDLGYGDVRRFDLSGLRTVTVSLDSGDDRFRTITGGTPADLPMVVDAGTGADDVVTGAAADLIDGGSGDDHLLGGAGTDVLVGDRGADFVDGGVGNDDEQLGSGDDVAAWDPGEGSDLVDGGLGEDTLVFNGSNGDERMSLAPNGTSVVFLRSPGNVRMDLDDVERLDLATLGGADAVTVGDLTGTDLGEAHVDLASSTGSGDAKTDSVVVTGSDAADHVDVSASAGAIDVSGLAARTVVRGSEPSDQLDLLTLGGDDHVAVDPAVDALVTFALDLGTGQL